VEPVRALGLTVSNQMQLLADEVIVSLMAQSEHHDCAEPCLLSGVKQTLSGVGEMSAYDPNTTKAVLRRG
jgi:hypothetical protein